MLQWENTSMFTLTAQTTMGSEETTKTQVLKYNCFNGKSQAFSPKSLYSHKSIDNH